MGIKLKEDYSERTQRVFGVIIGFSIGLLFLLVVGAFRTVEINWAAWIQAFGPFITIVGGFFFIRYEFKINLYKERDLIRVRFNNLINILEAPIRVSERVIEELGNGGDVDLFKLSLWKKSLESWIEFLDRLNYTEGSYFKAAIPLMGLRYQLDELRELCDHYFMGDGSVLRHDEDLFFIDNLIKKNFSQIKLLAHDV